MRGPLRTAATLATGEELVGGRVLDTNSQWLQQRLGPLGLRVVESRQVGDHPEDLDHALRELGARVDVLIVTGGLGPTEDDRTREALAQARGVGLHRSEEAEQAIDQFFAARGRRPSPSNMRQADLPVGAEGIPNAFGTAPGVWWPGERGVWVALPGVPDEMRALWETQVEPRLRGLELPAGLHQRSFSIVGLPESVVGERIAEWMRPGAAPLVSINAAVGVCRLVLVDVDDSEGHIRVQGVEASIRARFEAHEFSEEHDLARAVVATLSARGETLALAESCTGGMLGAALTAVPGASAVLLEGAVVYSNAAKQRTAGVSAETLERHGAVSEEVARELAAGIRQRADATWGVGITGIAGPDGGSVDKPVGTVHIAVSGPRESHRRWVFPGDREAVRRRSVAAAAQQLWTETRRASP